MANKVIFLPHANIQYSQLAPSRRAWVIQESYGKLFDLIASNDNYKIAFEASGVTLKVMNDECPNVLQKLKTLVAQGKIEAVGSPYTHVMLSNIDPKIGLYSLIDGLDAWEKYVGVRPVTGWNPECSWTNFIPEIYKEAGYETLVADADSFFLSFNEVREATGLSYDVSSHSNKNKLFLIEEYIKDKPEYLKYITNPSVADNGLQLILRSDMMANPMLWYLMGATEGHREKPIELSEINNMLATWNERINKSGSFIMPYAEDAEYIGTSAYFYVKQFNVARFFEHTPESTTRFANILDAAIKNNYELSTPSEVIKSSNNIIKNTLLSKIDNGIAWHGGTAKAWANTIYSRVMDPVCKNMLDGINNICEHLGVDWDTMDEDLKNARIALTNAYVSDSRWPPKPTSPGRFNVQESISDLYDTNALIKKSMIANKIKNIRSLYSPVLMESLVKLVEKELMEMSYFGEE